MKLIAIVLSWACLVFGADKNSAINGVWRAQVDGFAALVMTISEEGGELSGAILFYLIRRDEGHSPNATPGIPEPLFNVMFDGKVLDFRVSHHRSHGARTFNDPPMRFQLIITGPDEGLLVTEGKESEGIRVLRQ
jgi:hypothetical protein